MIVREERGEFRFEPADKPKAKIDVSGFWGTAPWLKVPSREDFEERPSTVAARKAAEAAAKKGCSATSSMPIARFMRCGRAPTPCARGSLQPRTPPSPFRV